MNPAPRNGHAYLDFNSPMSDARAYGLITTLQPLAGRTVVDFGCGWAELLLRVLETEPTARGLGVDEDDSGVRRGRANAEKRGLQEHVRLDLANVTTWEAPPADVAISIGASHAWGDTRKTLEAMRERIRPGGTLLLGDAFWERPPTADVLARLDATPEDYGSLAELVDLAMATGYRLLSLATANLDEWDSFESRWCAGRERWLLENPDHPEAAEVRSVVDAHRDNWLHGYRGHLGFAYLTLARR
ncbi:SAM-dependent methyltransferase [Umezawaea sp.]|uniref:SAM-dependent methyltransferase n=1 Tax=Umezawaea sp. TaxID=1955258 RepID=UPI002ECFD7D6